MVEDMLLEVESIAVAAVVLPSFVEVVLVVVVLFGAAEVDSFSL